MKKIYTIPKGYKVWKIVNTGPFGNFMVITTKKDIVSMFNFNGIDAGPITIYQYQVKNIK